VFLARAAATSFRRAGTRDITSRNTFFHGTVSVRVAMGQGLKREGHQSESRWPLCNCISNELITNGRNCDEPPSVQIHCEDLADYSSVSTDGPRGTSRTSQPFRPGDSASSLTRQASEESGSTLDNQEEPLARQISPALAAAVGAGDSQSRAVSSGNTLLLTSRIRSGVRGFQKSIENRFAPNICEKDRGVYIDRVYDLYCPSKKTIRTLRMADEAIRRRAKNGSKDSSNDLSVREPKHADPEDVDSRGSAGSSSNDLSVLDEDKEERWTLGSPGGSTFSRSSSLSSTRSDSEDEDHVSPFQRTLKRQNTMSNMELVTQWGVLVAKLQRYNFFDIRDACSSAIGEKRREANAKAGTVLTSLKNRAEVVCEQARQLAERVANEKIDKMDSEWEPEGVLVQLFSTQYLDTLIILANGTRKLLSSQPMLSQAHAPARIFGDIHGQFRDILLLFHAFGSPNKNPDCPTYIFNGDFVDRGEHQLEVLGVLFAMKLAYPNKVWLIRGNHEDRIMNVSYGLQAECMARLGKSFGVKIFDSVQKAFEQLPIGLVLENNILVVHGGIGRGKWNLSDCKGVRRPLTPEELAKPENEWIYDILWSDPIEEDAEGGVFGVHQSPRGKLASQFAWDVTKTFCARNGLSLIIRSHQSKIGSLGFEVMHEHLLMRVFSARDYEGHGNDSAVLSISKKDGDDLLYVRPQVLRSTTKLREENAEQKELIEAEKTERQKARARRKSVRSKESLKDPSKPRLDRRESDPDIDKASAEAKSLRRRPSDPDVSSAETRSLRRRPSDPGVSSAETRSLRRRPSDPDVSSADAKSLRRRPSDPDVAALQSPRTDDKEARRARRHLAKASQPPPSDSGR